MKVAQNSLLSLLAILRVLSKAIEDKVVVGLLAGLVDMEEDGPYQAIVSIMW